MFLISSSHGFVSWGWVSLQRFFESGSGAMEFLKIRSSKKNASDRTRKASCKIESCHTDHPANTIYILYILYTLYILQILLYVSSSGMYHYIRAVHGSYQTPRVRSDQDGSGRVGSRDPRVIVVPHAETTVSYTISMYRWKESMKSWHKGGSVGFFGFRPVSSESTYFVLCFTTHKYSSKSPLEDKKRNTTNVSRCFCRAVTINPCGRTHNQRLFIPGSFDATK